MPALDPDLFISGTSLVGEAWDSGYYVQGSVLSAREAVIVGETARLAELADLHTIQIDAGQIASPYVDVTTYSVLPGQSAATNTTNMKTAMAAATVLGARLYFPPNASAYDFAQDGAQSYCLDVLGGLHIFSVKGGATLRQVAGMPDEQISLFRVNGRRNVTFENIRISGNWGNAFTTVNDGLTTVYDPLPLPAATIPAYSTSGFPSSGTLLAINHLGAKQSITYTGKTATSFTGCSGGTGYLPHEAAIGYIDDNTGINHTTQLDPKNHGIMIRGSSNVTIVDCIVEQCYGDGIWIGGGADPNGHTPATDIKIIRTTVDTCARNAITLGAYLSGVVIRDCRLINSYTQAIDTEPQSDFLPCRDVFVDANHIGVWFNPDVQRIPISIIGAIQTNPSQTSVARNYRITNNTVMGPILISSGHDIYVGHNRVVCDFPGESYSPIYVDHYADSITIENNTVYARSDYADDFTRALIAVRQYAYSVRPIGVTVRGNWLYAKNGRRGIMIDGPGGAAGDTGTATSQGIEEVFDFFPTLTQTGKTWTVNQWIGHVVVMDGATAAITGNTADTLTLKKWATPLGQHAPTPATGAYKILSIGGVMMVDDNTIDCTDDGNGAGDVGVYLDSGEIGEIPSESRYVITLNKIRNATGPAIKVFSHNEDNPYRYLKIADNLAWDDQPVATCTSVIQFLNSAPSAAVNISKLVMHGNGSDGTVTTIHTGLSAGHYWTVSDGLPADFAGYGSPESVVTAKKGSRYARVDGGAGTCSYVKESDTTNTGWVAK